MTEPARQPGPRKHGKSDFQDAMTRLLDRPADSEDVREATLRVQQPLAVSDRDLVSLLAFRLNDELMGLPGEDVVRVVHIPSVHRIPHRTNTVIRGLCNVEGDLLICVDLRALLGMQKSAVNDVVAPGEPPPSQRMVVLGRQAETWAFVVDEVLGVVRLEAKSFLPPPATLQEDRQCFTRQLAPLPDGRTVAVLDANRLDSGFKAALT